MNDQTNKIVARSSGCHGYYYYYYYYYYYCCCCCCCCCLLLYPHSELLLIFTLSYSFKIEMHIVVLLNQNNSISEKCAYMIEHSLLNSECCIRDSAVTKGFLVRLLDVLGLLIFVGIIDGCLGPISSSVGCKSICWWPIAIGVAFSVLFPLLLRPLQFSRLFEACSLDCIGMSKSFGEAIRVSL